MMGGVHCTIFNNEGCSIISIVSNFPARGDKLKLSEDGAVWRANSILAGERERDSSFDTILWSLSLYNYSESLVLLAMVSVV